MNHVQRYDPALDAWDTSGPQMQRDRMSALTVVYGGLIYVVSGGGASGIWTPWSDTEVYDPSLWPGGSWSYHDESVTTPAVGIAGDCADDRVWGAGGLANGYVVTDVNRALDDGLTCTCGGGDIPWLSLAPTSGTVPAEDGQAVSFMFDASGLPVGCCDPAWVEVGNDTPYGSFPVPVTMTIAESVEIDIRPWSEHNFVNPFSRMVLPVALFGSDDFDVADADVTTLAFGPNGAPPAFDLTNPWVYFFSHWDVNGDGKKDLLSHYRTEETGISMGDTEACLTGETLDSTPFQGCDAVTTCGHGFEAALVMPPLVWIGGRIRRRRR
jgi:hypothetical protein